MGINNGRPTSCRGFEPFASCQTLEALDDGGVICDLHKPRPPVTALWLKQELLPR
jgi:hypothetical protein